MDEQYIGQISMTGFDFAPNGWAFCNGQTMPVNQNAALFSLLGTMYGGNGVTTFNLPNLQSRIPVGFGQGPGPAPYQLGQIGGTESVSLLTTQIPAHTHAVTGSLAVSNSQDNTSPAGEFPSIGTRMQYSAGPKNAAMAAAAVQNAATTPSGQGMPHENRQPVIAMNYIIALTGIFPSRG